MYLLHLLAFREADSCWLFAEVVPMSPRCCRAALQAVLFSLTTICAIPNEARALIIGQTVDAGEELIVEFQLDPARVDAGGLEPDAVAYLAVLVGWSYSDRGPVISELFETDGTFLDDHAYPRIDFRALGTQFGFFHLGDVFSDLGGTFTFKNLADPPLYIEDLEFDAYYKAGGAWALTGTTGSFTIVPEPGTGILLALGLACGSLADRQHRPRRSS